MRKRRETVSKFIARRFDSSSGVPEVATQRVVSCGELRDAVKTPKTTAADGVAESWNRGVEKVLTQLGKDLPRFANKITFVPQSRRSDILSDFQYFDGGFQPLFMDPYGTQPPLDEMVIAETRTEQQMRQLRSVIELFAGFLDPREAPKAYIESHFEEKFLVCSDLGFACALFLERAFLGSGEEVPSEFPTASPVVNVLRSVTQGHFAAVASAFQSRLGMENFARHLFHRVYVILPDTSFSAPAGPLLAQDSIEIVHYKAESASWGHLQWSLTVTVDSEGKDIQKIQFEIFQLSFEPHLTATKIEDITAALEPFFSVDLAIQLGRPVDWTLEGLTDCGRLDEKWACLGAAGCQKLVLDYNQIRTFSATFLLLSESLTSLSVTRNGLTIFPKEFTSLCRLK
jgi:hypothetical protein